MIEEPAIAALATIRAVAGSLRRQIGPMLADRLDAAADVLAAEERIAPAQGDAAASVAAMVDEWYRNPAAADVLAERRRQVEVEGWSPEHDDQHQRQELSLAAACYAMGTTTPYGKTLWPWHYSTWKPRNYRTNLVKAGALILAEIERLDRAAHKGDA